MMITSISNSITMRSIVKTLALFLVVLISVNSPSGVQAPPTLVHIGPVSPTVVEIVIQTGQVKPGTQTPYVKEDGDEIKTGRERSYLYRQGNKIGVLIGENQETLCPFDTISGGPLKASLIDDPGRYWIRSSDDAHYRRAQHPTAVHRKHRPTDIARTDDWTFQGPLLSISSLWCSPRLCRSTPHTPSP
jgi:hypothetical protein